MKKKQLILGLLALSLGAAVLTASAAALIPQPQSALWGDGVFTVTPATRIYTDPQSYDTGKFLAEQLRASVGGRFRISGKTSPDVEGMVKSGILLTTRDADAALGDEGYELTVRTNQVIIRAPTQAGLFYGAQTLLQLLPPQIYSSNVVKDVAWQAPCVQIRDWPRFHWRGLMLDVSRHFFNKAEVEQVLNAMATLKLNTFHWHLTDDQGWRIEIKKYPRLTSVGAWRAGVGFGFPSNSTTAYGPDGRYGGFYTQADIREIVDYAAARHITIVPEIEIPGHALAALTAYPEFGTGSGPFKIPLEGGVNPGVYDPAKPETFVFLDNVLTEVFQLFPGKFIHIGGDEVPPGPWDHDPGCQALMKREGLKNAAQLESWFIKRIETFANAHDRRLIGWSEIAHGGLAQNAAIMDWIGGGKEAAEAGHDVVMTPIPYCYFDMYQTRNQAGEPKAMGYGGVVSLRKVYSFEPILAGLAPEFAKHILGAQGNLWAEFIPNIRQAEYMFFPRAAALAEVTWSPKDARNYDDLVRRVSVNQQRLAELDVNYRNVALGDGSPTGTEVGGWKPAQIKNEFTPMEWDVTKHVTAAGKATVLFDYTQGACGIDIASAALLENGQEISRDAHDGFTGGHPRQPAYQLTVPAPKPGAQYTLRAEVKGDGGTDSRGNVLWLLKPGN